MFFSLLPKKVSKVTNVIVLLVTSIADINKFSLNISTFSFIKLSPTYTNWLAVVVYRDITMSLILLIFVNVYFTSSNNNRKWGITILTFILLLGGSQVLRVLKVIQYTGWTVYYEMLCIGGLMGVTYITARLTTKPSGEN